MSTNKQKENTLLKLIDINNKYFPILISISLSYIFCEFIERIEKGKIDDNTCVEYDKYMPICFFIDIKNKVSYDLAVSKDELIKAVTSKKLLKPNIMVTKDETTFKGVISDKSYRSVVLSILNIIDDVDDDSSMFSDFIKFGSPDYAFTDVLNDMKQFIKIGSIYNVLGKIDEINVKDILKGISSENLLDLGKESGKKGTKDKIDNILLQGKTKLSDLLGSLQKISAGDIDNQYTILMKDNIFNKMIDKNNVICITLDLIDNDMYVAYKDDDSIHIINFYHCDSIIKEAKDHIDDKIKTDSQILENKEPVGLVVVNVYTSRPSISLILDNNSKSPNKFSEGVESLMIELERAYKK